MKFLMTFLLLSAYIKVMSYDCRSYTLAQARVICYENAEIIFSGTAISKKDKIVSFKIEESYKGINIFFIDVLFNDYNIPKIGERWLVYTYKSKEGNYFVDDCTISRSFNNPEICQYGNYAPKPQITMNTNPLHQEIAYVDWNTIRLKAKIDLLEEIIILQQNKRKSAFQTNELAINKLKLQVKYFKIMIIVLFILIIISFFYRFKQKQ